MTSLAQGSQAGYSPRRHWALPCPSQKEPLSCLKVTFVSVNAPVREVKAGALFK